MRSTNAEKNNTRGKKRSSYPVFSSASKCRRKFWGCRFHGRSLTKTERKSRNEKLKKNLQRNESCCAQTERKADQVWLGQAAVALGTLEAAQWGLELQLQEVAEEVEELQPQLLQLGRAQL